MVEANSIKQVLNAGSGPRSNQYIHPVFKTAGWRESRLDIDPQASPDVVASIVNMAAIPNDNFDAIWSSHSLEHLYAHEVPLALSEFARILKPDGFALITSPDLEAIASLILQNGVDQPAYVSPAGPITAHDMLFGHSESIARGNKFMAHKTGFTCASLGQLLVNAGFAVVLVKRGDLDLWALALMQDANKSKIQQELRAFGLDMFE